MSPISPPLKPSRWLFLLAGGLMLFVVGVGDGGIVSALCAWLPAVLFLRFTRLSRPLIGYLSVAAVSAAAIHILWRGMIPVPPIAYVVVCVIIGLTAGLPYLIDRWLSPRLRGVAATLIFPATMVFVEFAGSLKAPFGTWGSLAYSQAGLPVVAATVAIAGLWGLVFLMAWFASCINAVMSQDQDKRQKMRLAFAWSSAFAIALFSSQVLLLSAPESNKVRVAAIKPVAARPSMFEACDGAAIECRRRVAQSRQQALFDDSATAAQQGAKLLLWSEAAAEVMQQDEAALIQRGRDFARERGVYLAMALLTVPADFPESRLVDDKLILLTPSGEIAWQYRKNKPVPGEPIIAGDGRIPVLATPFGTIANVICFDADFPSLVRQAATQQADLLLVSAADWPRISNLHAEMAVFRARENGMALLRSTGTYPQKRVEQSLGIVSSGPAPTLGGVSFAADAGGSVVALDNDEASILVSDLPSRGHWTPYRTIGDSLAWMCLLMLVSLGIKTAVAARGTAKQANTGLQSPRQ